MAPATVRRDVIHKREAAFSTANHFTSQIEISEKQASFAMTSLSPVSRIEREQNPDVVSPTEMSVSVSVISDRSADIASYEMTSLMGYVLIGGILCVLLVVILIAVLVVFLFRRMGRYKGYCRTPSTYYRNRQANSHVLRRMRSDQPVSSLYHKSNIYAHINSDDDSMDDLSTFFDSLSSSPSEVLDSDGYLHPVASAQEAGTATTSSSSSAATATTTVSDKRRSHMRRGTRTSGMREATGGASAAWESAAVPSSKNSFLVAAIIETRLSDMDASSSGDGAQTNWSDAVGAVSDAVMTDASTPDTAMPDGRTMNAKFMDATVSDATMLDATIHDGTRSDALMSDASMSDASMPDTSMTDATMSGATINDTTMSNVAISDAPMPNAPMTDIELIPASPTKNPRETPARPTPISRPKTPVSVARVPVDVRSQTPALPTGIAGKTPASQRTHFTLPFTGMPSKPKTTTTSYNKEDLRPTASSRRLHKERKSARGTMVTSRQKTLSSKPGFYTTREATVATSEITSAEQTREKRKKAPTVSEEDDEAMIPPKSLATKELDTAVEKQEPPYENTGHRALSLRSRVFVPTALSCLQHLGNV